MGSYSAKKDARKDARKDESLEKIAQIMSEKAHCKVNTNDIRTEVCTSTTSIYSAVVHEKEKDTLSGAICIICTVRKWKREYEYEVKSGKIA